MTSANPAKSNRPQDDEEPLPPFSEQVAQQLGGARGMIESSIPVAVFVLVNIVWALTPAVIVAVLAALGIAVFRLSQKQPIRHAINGLFGIAIGAFIAFQTGKPEDFYLPGILISLGYAVAMIISVVVRMPLVGWLWSVVADNGSMRWREHAGLRRTFGWLTLLWAAVYIVKVIVNCVVYFNDSLTGDEKAGILGVMRIALGVPPYALLLALTIWAVRRQLRRNPIADPDVLPGLTTT